MQKRIIALFMILAALCLLIAFSGCGAKTEQKPAAAPQKLKVTDLAGREVEIAAPVKKVVAIGPGALRLVCYVQGPDKVVGVEEVEKN